MNIKSLGAFGVTAMLFSPISAAAPELTGTPGDLTNFLKAQTRTVTLQESADEKAYTDRAIVTLAVTTESRLLANALESNRSLRQTALSSLVQAGIPAKNIRSSEFSTSPQYGWFGSKPNSFEVTNVVVVRVADEKQFQAVAGLADEFSEIQFSKTTFEHSEEDLYKAMVRKQALEKVMMTRAFYEQELGLRLRPVSFSSSARGGGPQGMIEEVMVTGSRLRMSSKSAGPDYALPEGFDEIEYKANVSVTFEIVLPDQ